MSDKMHQNTCKGHKQDGTPCGRRIGLINGYCYHHRDQATEAVAPEGTKTPEGKTFTRRKLLSADGMKRTAKVALGWVASNLAWDGVTELADAVDEPLKELVDVKKLIVPDQPAAPLPESPLSPSLHSIEPEMILVPAGEFLMGSDPLKDKRAIDPEQPQHVLYLPNYYLAKTQVTNAQYWAFLQSTGYERPRHWQDKTPPRGKKKHPAVYVSWNDAIAYCRWLAEVTGRPYRLPTEAEWEKGARGTDGRIYPWGDQWDAKRCNTIESGKADTTPVGAYPQGASPYGLLDMAGNVCEWTSSLYQAYPYRADDGREDLSSSNRRVLRGGAFDYVERDARCASRSWYDPSLRSWGEGFRVAAAHFSHESGL